MTRINPSYRFLFLFIFLGYTKAFGAFDFNANCLKAYQYIFELKIPLARQLIAQEKKLRPQNAIVPLLENYIDYFYLLGAESKEEFERLEKNKSVRLNRISNDDSQSPYYLYAQAEINLQWALLRGRLGSYFTAARELNRAYSLLQENKKKFPSFPLNNKGLGFIQASLGALPEGFLKSTLATFGLKGDIQQGSSLLEQLAEKLPKSTYEPFYEEVVFYYVYILYDVTRNPQAYSKTMKYTARFADSSLLKTYLQAYVSLKTGQNEQALIALGNRPTGTAYQPFPYLDYLHGLALLNKLDYSAEAYFEKFLQENKGVNYIKDCYLHLAWLAYLKDDEAESRMYLSKVKQLGFTYQEADKQALNEANAPMPPKALLKSRLLYDGGYLTQASLVLAGISPEKLDKPEDKAAFYYRSGRVATDQGKDELALAHFQKAYQTGKGLRQYYAAKACVLAGKICEKNKDFSKAKSWFEQAISLKNHEYEAGIENEARQGLKRLP